MHVFKTRLTHILSPKFQTFLNKHQNDDVSKLLLSKNADIDTKEAADQLLSKRKAKDKLPDWFNTTGIVFPPPLSIEQSSSQEAANYKKQLLHGEQLVDLTGGMGADCLALSQNFTRTTYVERDEWLCTVFRHNQKLLSDKALQVVNTTAEEYLDQMAGKASFFIDPARRDVHRNKVFRFEDCTPDLTALLPDLKEKAEKVLVKAAPLIDLSLGIIQLQNVCEIHVLGVKNEVKEVLFLLDFDFTGEPLIHCVNFGDNQETYTFSLSDEKEVKPSFAETKTYLYDPNTSILKAGAFKSISAKYCLEKLAPNTHLYTADEFVEDFPGRKFEVITPDLKKNQVKELIPEAKANVFTKNYPVKPEALKKKLRLKDGGELFVIGYRNVQDKPMVALCRKR